MWQKLVPIVVVMFNYIWYSYVGNFLFCGLYYGDTEI